MNTQRNLGYNKESQYIREINMRIVEVNNRTSTLINQLLEVWENSVKATHLFLSDEEIIKIKNMCHKH